MEVSERGRKRVHRLVKTESKREVEEGGGERGDGMVELTGEGEVGESRREREGHGCVVLDREVGKEGKGRDLV